MTAESTFNDSINKTAYWCALLLLAMAVLSLMLPLDAPEGPFADRMIWFSAHLGVFITGWIVQMIAMLTLTGVFAATAWQLRGTHPLSVIVASTALLISLVAFIIPKFIAIWSIPQMVIASATVSPDFVVAEQLFQLLSPSLPYSLFTSFDYLGFWMYGVFGLLLAPGLLQRSLSEKIAGVTLGLFGVLFHVLFVAVLIGKVVSADIGILFESMGVLLIVPVVSMAVCFRKAIKA